MSYVPNKRQLGSLLTNLSKVDFFEWGTRPLGFHFWDIDMTAYDVYYQKFIGRKFKYVIVLNKGSYEIQYRNKKQHEDFINQLQKEFASFSVLARHEKILSNIYKDIWKFCGKMQKLRWEKFTNKELSKWYVEYFRHYAQFLGAVSSAILLMESMANELRHKIAATGTTTESLELQIRTLATPLNLSATAQEELALLRLLKSDKKNFENKLQKHIKKWAYIPMYTQFAPWSLADYKIRIKALAPREIKRRFDELVSHKAHAQKASQEAIKALGLDARAQKLADLLSKYLFWRISDETTVGLFTYSRAGLFKEIAKRLFVSPIQLQYMIQSEVVSALDKGSVDLQAINERTKGYAFVQNPKGVALVFGKDLQAMLQKVNLTAKVVNRQSAQEMQGTPANPGIVRGKVCIIRDTSLIGKVKKDNILVTPQTTPAYIQAMKIAGAIITEEGGITSHAAIVSRELGVPCVIGVPNVTRILKDGDMVEVDASKGIIKILK